jgi:glycosyltransferase involved in cell wall biosynthesis
MNLAIDFTSAVKSEPTGVARYVIELLRAMIRRLDANDQVILGYRLSRWHRRRHAPRFDDPRVRVRPLQSPLAFLTYGAPDVYHGLGVNVPLGLPRSTRRFVTVHGFIAPEEVAADRRDDYKRRLRKTATMLARAHRGILQSNFELERTAELCGCSVEKLTVVYHGVDHERFRPDADPQLDAARLTTKRPARPFFLAIGALTERKNIPRLLDAWERTRARREFDLVLAGQARSESGPILDRIVGLGLAEEVRAIGHVAMDEIPSWIRASRALVHPALYESFGLPVIEAMACGAPVTCSNTAALPEIAGGAALHFDPTETDAIANAIDKLAFDSELWSGLRERGLRRAAQFTWDASAEATLREYRRELDR